MPNECESICTQEKVLVRDKTGRPGRLWKRWSIADIQTLMELSENREKMDVITRKLDRSEISVRCKMANLGLRCLQDKPVPRRPATEPWTVADEAILIKEWNAGTPVKTIAKKLVRTLVAVRKKRKRLQLNVRHVKSVDGLAIQQKYETGVTINELVTEFNISEYAVKSILKKRLYFNYQLVRAQEQEIIEERYKDGCTTNCIAHRVRKSRSTVQNFINEADLHNDFQSQVQNIIVERYKDGCTTNCIAHRVRKSRSIVQNYINEADLHIDFQSLDDLVFQLLEFNLTVDQIGAKLELPRISILAALKRLRRADNV